MKMQQNVALPKKIQHFLQRETTAPPEIIDYFCVYCYTNCVSLKVICVSLNVKLCIFKVHCQENH